LDQAIDSGRTDKSGHVVLGQSSSAARGDGEVPLLCSAHASREVPGVLGSLPCRGAEIWQRAGSGEGGLLYFAKQAGVHPVEGGRRDIGAVLLLLRRMSLTRKTRNYLVFLWRCARIAFVGDWRYYAWMGLLTVVVLLGINSYAKQFVNGLITTGMSDQVS